MGVREVLMGISDKLFQVPLIIINKDKPPQSANNELGHGLYKISLKLKGKWAWDKEELEAKLANLNGAKRTKKSRLTWLIFKYSFSNFLFPFNVLGYFNNLDLV